MKNTHNPKLTANSRALRKEMTKEDDGTYSYTIERNWNSPLIIFNDGAYTDSVQYPEGKGLKVEADKTYSVKED